MSQTPGALHLFHPCAITFHCPVFREISLAIALCSPPLYSQLSSFLFFFYFLFSILRRVFLHLLFSNRHLHFSDFIIIVVVVHVIIILHPLIGIITPVYCGLQPRDRAVPYRAMRYVMKFTFGTWSFPTRKKTVA